MPDQLVPDQLVLDQEVLDQEVPDQEVPDQEVPDQEVLDQLVLDQEVLDQEVLDQEVLDQSSFPVQAVAVVEASSHARASQAAPVTVNSPVKSLPSIVTWSSPRAASSEPVPRAVAPAWKVLTGAVVSAVRRFTTPSPWSFSG